MIARLHLGLLLICLSTIAVACRLTEPNVRPRLSPERLLLNRRWQLGAQLVQPAVTLPDSNHPQVDLMPSHRPCDRDDCLRFAEHGVWTLSEGPTACQSRPDSLITYGSWAFTTADDTLRLHTVNREGDSQTYQILHLDSTLLIRQFLYPYDHALRTITETFYTIP